MLPAYAWCDLYSDIEAARSRDDLIALVSFAATKLGFTYWAYGVKPRFPPGLSGVETIDTYPTGWMDYYRQAEFLSIDSSISLAVSLGTTIVWSEAKTAASASLWGHASDFGLKVGLAHPVWDRAGALGLFSLSRGSTPITTSELKAIAPAVTWLSALLHAKMTTLKGTNASPIAGLSERELEVLRWTATGKTASEIASITGITTRTVNFHVGNILTKLNAQNKIQAAIRGLSLGLI
jgi:LuxR family quorum-sensing system transcriptional regulator SolR